MDAHDLASECPICREVHRGGFCTPLNPFTIVLLEIDEWTPQEALRAAESALTRAAEEMARRVN